MTEDTQRTLSSTRTVLFKFLLPALWTVGFGPGLLSIWLAVNAYYDRSGRPTPAQVTFVFPLLWLVGAVVIFWNTRLLRRVRLDGEFLYVSDYLHEVRVPLSEVVDIHESRWLNPHPVTLELRESTEMGDRVVFIPKVRLALRRSEHPVVSELRALVEQAGGHLSGI